MMRISRWLFHVELLPFVVIGVANTLIHGAILVSAVERLGLNVTLSNGLAFVIANLFSYFANSAFTFKVAATLARYGRFLAASLLSLGLTLLISMTAEHYGLHYLLGFAVIVVCVPLFSFFIMKFWTFAGHKQLASRDTRSQK